MRQVHDTEFERALHERWHWLRRQTAMTAKLEAKSVVEGAVWLQIRMLEILALKAKLDAVGVEKQLR